MFILYVIVVCVCVCVHDDDLLFNTPGATRKIWRNNTATSADGAVSRWTYISSLTLWLFYDSPLFSLRIGCTHFWHTVKSHINGRFCKRRIGTSWIRCIRWGNNSRTDLSMNRKSFKNDIHRVLNLIAEIFLFAQMMEFPDAKCPSWK